MTLNQVTDRYRKLQGQRELLEKDLKKRRSTLKSQEKSLEDHIKARWVLTEVAKITQERFKRRVESLVTLAVRSVFDRLFEFKLRFAQERNRFVCEPLIVEDGHEYIPKDDMGGSIIDLISFAFRVVLWSLENPRSRAIFILDEPMKFVGKGEELLKGGSMIRQVSHKLGFQTVLVTHEPELAEIADKAWQVRRVNKRSLVTVIKAPKHIRKLVKRNRASKN